MPNNTQTNRDGAFLVTGAASGMGRAAVHLLADRGIPVIAVDLSEPGLKELRAEVDTPIETSRLDVSDRTDVHRVFDEVASRGTTVRAVLHFAGIFDDTAIADIDAATLDRVLAVNLAGSIWMCQAALGHMRRNGAGAIVLTASDSARAGSTVSGPAYSASKGAVIALTRTLAVTAGRDNIRVNAVCPGLTDTGMSTTWSPAIVDAYVARTPLGRLAAAQEIASVAICLAGEEMSFVNGEVIEVNGGNFFD